MRGNRNLVGTFADHPDLFDVFVGLVKRNLARSFAPTYRHPPCDPCHPVLHVFHLGEPLALAQDAEKRLLYGIFGVGGIPKDRVRDLVHQACMVADSDFHQVHGGVTRSFRGHAHDFRRHRLSRHCIPVLLYRRPPSAAQRSNFFIGTDAHRKWVEAIAVAARSPQRRAPASGECRRYQPRAAGSRSSAQ